MNLAIFYSIVGVIILMMGFNGLVSDRHLLRKVLAINLMGTGIFMFLIALAHRQTDGSPDPIPHAMVLTGIVVAVSATALLLALVVRLNAATGKTSFEEIVNDTGEDPA